MCVFYDRVVLPYDIDASVDSISFDLSDTHQTVETLQELSKDHFTAREETWSDARTWDKRNHILFEQGVITRLDAPRN